MIGGALLYYQFHSWWNRLQTRIRRLRQPKYLFGAIVGGLYFYFYLFRGLASARHGAWAGAGMAIPVEMTGLAQTLAAAGFMVVVLLAWILPHSRTALAFTEAEVAFLFPAPVSRKTLIHFKLLKSQTAILFSALLMTFIGRGWSGGHLLTRALGWWVGMSIFNLHLLGSSFALTRLMDRGLSTWARRALILGSAAAAVVGIFFWVRHSLPPFPAPADQEGLAWLFHYLAQVFASGPLPYLLYPFRLIVAPYFAPSYWQFLKDIGPALGLLALHYLWVIHSNVAFEEASVELSRRMADRMAAVRAGNWRAARQPKKAARPPFVLRPTGHPALALLWKNLISAGLYVTARVWLILVWAVVASAIMLQSLSAHGAGIGLVVVVTVGTTLAMSLFSGPQILRNDLRQDLPVADVLKLYPMPGWQVVLGEVLAPAVMLAGVQWLLVLFGIIFFPEQFDKYAFPLPLRLSVALAAVILFFPAWFQMGKDAPRGFETMGQQLILMFGQLLVLVLGLLLPGVIFALFMWGGSFIHWPLLGMVLGALIAAMILAVEAGLGIKLLGGAFEKFDVSGELI
jgi:ABC-2 type transport system permease protein